MTNPFDVNRFWNFVSSFFAFLDDKSKNMVVNFWHGLHTIGNHMLSRAQEFHDAQAPENAQTGTQENFYELQVGPLRSIPVALDPTEINSKYILTPKSRVVSEPVYVNGQPVYSDMVEISAQDYYAIRDIGIGMYLVIDVKKEGVPKKYFKIKNLKSSEEQPDGSRYYPPTRIV